MILIPAPEPLKQRSEIDLVFKKGQKFQVAEFIFRFCFHNENLSESDFKLMVAVPKKRVRKATDRNRIKRLMREAFRLNLNLLSNFRGRLSIIVIFTGQGNIAFNEVSGFFSLALQKIAATTCEKASKVSPQ